VGATPIGALVLSAALPPDAVVVTLAVDSGFKYMTGPPYAG
jgi:cysteine synthase